jgi:hypothetical protein
MHDSMLVGMMDRPREGLDEFRRGANRLGPAIESVGQTAAFHVFQAQEWHAVLLAHLMDLDDIGMPEPSDRFGFAAKALALGSAGMRPGEDHFEGNEPIKTQLARFVDDAHTAASNFLDDFVAANFAGK